MDRTTDGDGGWFEVDRPPGQTHVPVAVDVTGTVSVDIQGRVDGESPALTLQAAVVADGGLVVAWFPQMRAVVSGVGGGEAAKAWIAAEGRRVTAAS
jgi:hypothetical protein